MIKVPVVMIIMKIVTVRMINNPIDKLLIPLKLEKTNKIMIHSNITENIN